MPADPSATPARAAIAIEVVYAGPGRQWLYAAAVPAGTTARAALALVPLARDCPALDLGACPLGIYGRPVADGQPLRAGDRVEVYRPLQADPRAARQAAVARGTNLGRRGPGAPGGSA